MNRARPRIFQQDSATPEKDDAKIPQHSSDRAHSYSSADPYFFFLAVLLYLNDHSKLTKKRLSTLVNILNSTTTERLVRLSRFPVSDSKLY
jgi:hypothetical protein